MVRISIVSTWVLVTSSAMLFGACSSAGPGGSAAPGTGGNVIAATGGSVAVGTGGSVAAGTGGSAAPGSGGNAVVGSGGSVATGIGGSVIGGTGGSGAVGIGGSGTGGSVATGSGGSVATGTGGKTGAGGSTGVGGNMGVGGKIGSGGSTGVGGNAGVGGNVGVGGNTGVGGNSTQGCGVGPTPGAPGFGTPALTGTGNSTVKYSSGDVTRDGVTYRFITNWWGQGWTSSSVTWSGTSFAVQAAAGTSTPDGTPIGYPTTYCGRYSETAAHGDCGLPAAYSSIDKLWTGWKWHSADTGQYNAAWDIWLGTASAFQSYLMVWLRDPAGRQPAGNSVINNVTVANVPGTWNIRYGSVNSRPIVNYVRNEGEDACEFEFNVMDFINDATARAATTTGLTLPGDTVRAVAVGFEFWTGPFANVSSDDFYVKLMKK